MNAIRQFHRQGWHAYRAPYSRTAHWGLSRAEWRVVKALCAGADTRRKLADACCITERTVGTHICKIHAHLGTDSIAGIILKVMSDEAARNECFPELRSHDTATADSLRKVPTSIWFD